MIRSFAAACVCLGLASSLFAQEFSAKPQKEHEWLQQLVGEWETEGEAMLGPDKTVKCSGTESVRSLAGFWTISEQKGEFMGVAVTGSMTLGYDPTTKKYIGTWIDSTNSHLWKYEGTLDEAGKVLTLEAEGPNPMTPGKMAKYRDAIEIKDKDTKVMTSSIQLEDGKWVQFMKMEHRRKK